MSATIIGHIPMDIFGNATGGSTQAMPQMRAWYQAGWIKVYRPLDNGEVIADCFKSLAKDMNSIKQEPNLWKVCEKNNWNLPATISDSYSCYDNLTLISCILRFAGYHLSSPLTLDTISILETRYGFQPLIGSKYLTSSLWLCPGDIIISNKHLALVLENNNIVVKRSVAPIGIGELVISQDVDVQLAGAGNKYSRVYAGQKFVVAGIVSTKYQFYLNFDANIKAFIECDKCTFYPTVEQKITNYKVQSNAPTITFLDDDGFRPIKKVAAVVPQIYTIIMEKGDLGKVKGCPGWVNLKNFVKID